MRLFVSIDPPAEIAAELARSAALAGWPGARVTAADHVHLTAHFIGETSVREQEAVMESVERSAAGLGPFSLSITGLVALPEEGPVRLVAAVTDRPATLLEVHRRLVHRLARRPGAAREDGFFPHMTVARFPQPPREPLELGVWWAPITFRVEVLAVKASVLTAGGAEHRVVRLVGLRGG